MVAGGGGAGDQPLVRARQRVGDRATLVSGHSAGRSAGIADSKINDTRLYRCLDRLLPHKTKLERHLKQRYGELFVATFDVLLYDLTSSYVEGRQQRIR